MAPTEGIFLPTARAVACLLWRLLWCAARLAACLLRQALSLVYSTIVLGVQAKQGDSLEDQLHESHGTAAGSASDAAASGELRRRRGGGEAAKEPVAGSAGGDGESPEEDEDDQGVLRLRLLRLPGASREEVEAAVEEVRQSAEGGGGQLRFSVREEEEPSGTAMIAVLGPGAAARGACATLRAALCTTLPSAVPPEEEAVDNFFALHFAMREAWDLPEDDELLDAALIEDWVDLGSGAGGAGGQQPQQQPPSEEMEPPVAAATPEPSGRPAAAVLRARLMELLPRHGGLHLFVDRNPFATWGQEAVRVDVLGPLTPEAWEAATSLVLACEGHRVYLSRRYDAIFWPDLELQPHIERQLACARAHWKGQPIALSGSETLGLAGVLLTGFEDLAANIKAVLRGSTPPGWHRLEWTPHGAGAVPHLTY